MGHKLSIIIPYYNCKEYTDELLDVLAPQMRHDVEVIVVDDGSKIPFETHYPWCRVMRKENGGAATARNLGLINTDGEYVQFIDADDLVPDYFVERLFKTIDEEHPDVIEYSWRSLNKEGSQHDVRLITIADRLTNPSVCTRGFKRTFIGATRFNEKKDCTEDEDFSRKLGYLREDTVMKRAIIPEYMYYYRTAVSNSKVKRFKKGIQKTKRIVYHYEYVTADMTWLFDEVKKEDEVNEVWVITRQCDIPDMKRYARVSYEKRIWGHELRGEPYPGFQLIVPPMQVDIVMYCEHSNFICGIFTFIYNTCQHLKSHYKIAVVYEDFDKAQIEKLEKIVPVIKNDPKKEIMCNALILNRLTDKIPPNITHEKTIQMCHACYLPTRPIPADRDHLVNVSQAAKNSWKGAAEDGVVIHNMSYPEPEKTLMLVSATRTKASDKGQCEKRMRKLAEMLNDARIPFVWLVFSDKGLDNPPENVVNMGSRLNIQGYIDRADYLVQLSDQEAYSMSILEALCLKTAVVVTDFPSAKEEGVIDGYNGYVLPMNMDFDVRKLLNVPEFEFSYDNEAIVTQWKELIEAPVVRKPVAKYIRVRVVTPFKDVKTGRMVYMGETSFTRERVNEILEVERNKHIHIIDVLERT